MWVVYSGEVRGEMGRMGGVGTWVLLLYVMYRLI
jgi:hypothetical protein